MKYKEYINLIEKIFCKDYMAFSFVGIILFMPFFLIGFIWRFLLK